MRKDLAVLGDFEMRSRRGRALDALISSFFREQPLSLDRIEEMWESLSPEEQKISYDTVVMMRMRALLAEGKEYQAYQALIGGLQLNPGNLALQLELDSCLGTCHAKLEQLLCDDPQNPLVEVLYQALLREAHVNPVVQGRYLNTLARQGRFHEAAQLAFPLIALCPGMVGLRDTVETVAAQVPDTKFTKFLASPPAGLARKVVTSVLTPKKTLELKRKFRQVQNEISNESATGAASKILREVLGDFNDLSDLDMAYKDFYYFLAIVTGNNGKNWEAISLLQALVEADPCHLFFRRALEVEFNRFCENTVQRTEKKELKIDLSRAYAVLREIGCVPYSFLRQVCLYEVAAGETVSARMKMDQLMALNPFDGDYLLAALDVAIEAKDQVWMQLLLAKLEELKKDRPWILRLVAVGGDEGDST